MRAGLPAEGFLRHKGLILVAAGGAVTEAGLLTLLAPAARPVAPQMTALPVLRLPRPALAVRRRPVLGGLRRRVHGGAAGQVGHGHGAAAAGLAAGTAPAEAEPRVRVLRGADGAGLAAADARRHAGV